MSNAQEVFDFIKKKCINNELDERSDCYRELSNMLTATIGERSVLAYVRKLAYAGLIKFDEFSRRIILTRKGRVTQSINDLALGI